MVFRWRTQRKTTPAASASVASQHFLMTQPPLLLLRLRAAALALRGGDARRGITHQRNSFTSPVTGRIWKNGRSAKAQARQRAASRNRAPLQPPLSAPRNRRRFESCHLLIEADSSRDDTHSDSGARSLAKTHVQIENRTSTEVFHHSAVALFSRQV